jgi:polygalacturonase
MTSTTSRREFLTRLAAGAAAAVGAPFVVTGCHTTRPGVSLTSRGPATGWHLVREIERRIVAPTFPDRAFDITQFGAVGDGTTDCTDAFRRAIAACRAADGGRVVVPAGRFLTGPIHLTSRTNLHVVRDATVAFTQDPARYLPAVLTRFEGTELKNYSPFIYAVDQQDIAITGEGTLDGQADEAHWWPWKGSPGGGWKPGMPNYNEARLRLLAMAERGEPVERRVFGEGDYLRPNFIQPYRCRNVLIEGVTIVRSPMWEIHPVLSSNVIVRHVSIDSHGPNNDGCNPESCRDVLIEDCTFDTGDDCIAIKSGRNADGRRINVSSENIIIRGCRMKDGHGGVTLGSECTGGIRNVFTERCQMDSPNLDRVLRLKNNAMRGGTLEHVYMRDVTVGQVADSILSIDFYYEEGDKGEFTPVARDVEVRNVTSKRSPYALYLRGFERAPISDVRVIDCRFDGVEKGNRVEQVNGLVMQNVSINGSVVRT